MAKKFAFNLLKKDVTKIPSAGPMPWHREERAGIHGEKTLHI